MPTVFIIGPLCRLFVLTVISISILQGWGYGDTWSHRQPIRRWTVCQLVETVSLLFMCATVLWVLLAVGFGRSRKADPRVVVRFYSFLSSLLKPCHNRCPAAVRSFGSRVWLSLEFESTSTQSVCESSIFRVRVREYFGLEFNIWRRVCCAYDCHRCTCGGRCKDFPPSTAASAASAAAVVVIAAGRSTGEAGRAGLDSGGGDDEAGAVQCLSAWLACLIWPYAGQVFHILSLLKQWARRSKSAEPMLREPIEKIAHTSKQR